MTTIAQAAHDHLTERGEDFVMWGDSRLLHEINARAGRPARSWRTEKYVLDALDRSPLFVKRYVRLGGLGSGKRLVRCFELKGKEPNP